MFQSKKSFRTGPLSIYNIQIETCGSAEYMSVYIVIKTLHLRILWGYPQLGLEIQYIQDSLPTLRQSPDTQPLLA